MRVRSTIALAACVVAAFILAGPSAAAPLFVPPSPLERAPLVRDVQFFWPFSAPLPPPSRRSWNQPNVVRRPGPLPGPQQVAPLPAAPSAPAAPRGPAATALGDAPANENTTRVVVFGDTMGSGLADALASILTEEDGYQVQRMTRPNSGLVRTDYYDWAGEVGKAIVDQKIDVAVWMVGINDRQEISAEGETFAPKTPRWTEIYQARVDTLIKMLQDHGTAVYWVGLPIMRAQRYSQDIAYINSAVRERAGLLGAEYIDVWDAFADAEGAYASDGPDLNGERRRMRREDGIHMTDAGNAKLAHFVDQAIQGDISVAGLGVDGRRVIRQSRSGGLVVEPGTGGGEAVADELAGANPESDAEGEGLGGPSIALSANGGNGTAGGEAEISPLFQVLMRGEALDPKPGRADDFSWPRK